MLCFPVLLLSFGLISHPYLISFHFACLSFSQDTLSETIQSLYCTTNHTNKRNTLKSHIIAPSLPSHYFNWPNLKNSKELQVLWQCHYLFSALQENLGKILRLTGIAGFYNPKEINVTSVSSRDTWYVQACTRTEAVQKIVFISQRSNCPLIASFHVHFCFAENCSHQEIILIIFFSPPAKCHGWLWTWSCEYQQVAAWLQNLGGGRHGGTGAIYPALVVLDSFAWVKPH